MEQLLAQPRLSVITRHADSELARIHDAIEHKVLVDGRADVEDVLSRLLFVDGPRTPKTLDLIGHSTANGSLLQLGDWVLDATSPTVTAFFRELADYDVLPRLGVHAVRLLGCKTADSAHARSTICVLSEILGLEVYGTTGLVFSAHYAKQGFSDDWRFLLVGASDLRSAVRDRDPTIGLAAYDRSLDIDTLPLVPLEDPSHSWPRLVANDRMARSILRLVRRHQGTLAPGLLATPNCEIAIPSSLTGLYHVAQIVLDGQFIRVYPKDSNIGVLFPVEYPHALRSLVETLPTSVETLPTSS